MLSRIIQFTALASLCTMPLVACSSAPSHDESESADNAMVASKDPKAFVKKIQDFLKYKHVAGGVSAWGDETKTTVSADFIVEPLNPGPMQCTDEEFGPYCNVQTCLDEAPPGSLDPSEFPEVSVGTIKLHGAKEPVSLAPDKTQSFFYPEKDFGKLWEPGDIVLWTFSGAFPIPPAVQRQQAPIVIDVTSTIPTEIDGTRDISVTWTHQTAAIAGLGAEVSANIFAYQTPAGVNPAIVSCRVPVGAKRLDIPAAALAKLPHAESGFVIQEQSTVRVHKFKRQYTYSMGSTTRAFGNVLVK